jgi:uncharacterized protein (TIGR02271 family)
MKNGFSLITSPYSLFTLSFDPFVGTAVAVGAVRIDAPAKGLRMKRVTGANVSEESKRRRTADAGAKATADANELQKALRRNGGAAAAVVPVIAEDLQVGRRSVETGRVLVTKLVREQQQVVDEPTVTEEVVVERVPVNRYVDGPVEPRQEGETLVLPVLEEVVVVERRLMLKEEVRITKRKSESHKPQTVTLRSEDVKIDRIPAQAGREGT